MAGSTVLNDIVLLRFASIITEIPIPSLAATARKAGFLPTIPNEFLSDVRSAGSVVIEDVLLSGFFTETGGARGNWGNNILSGHSGGWSGWYRGGAGFDFVSYAGSETGVVASLDKSSPKLALETGAAAGHARYASVEGLIGSDHDDILVGDRKGNVVFGGDGNDRLVGDWGGSGKGDLLVGGRGQDVLFGGGGNDILVGGSDEDLFVFDLSAHAASPDARAGVDRILDFEKGDRIYLNFVTEDADDVILNFTAGDTGTHEVGHVALAVCEDMYDDMYALIGDAPAAVIYTTANGWLSYDPDGIGPRSPIHFATLLSDPLGVYEEMSDSDIVMGSYQGTSQEGTGI